jgi:hypothetical protein
MTLQMTVSEGNPSLYAMMMGLAVPAKLPCTFDY